jgi:hypothetical protein
MKLQTVAAVLSSLLALYACIPYALSIVKGKTIPHQLSWLVFTIMQGIAVISQLLEGARGSVLISIVFFVSSAVNFSLSLKYGVRKSSPYDKLLFSFALISIIIWYLTRSNATAIWLTALIDVFATTMIILKLHAHPFSEAPYPWLIATTAYVFTCLTLVGKPVGILYVRPLYGLLSEVAVLIAILLFRRNSTQTTTATPTGT